MSTDDAGQEQGDEGTEGEGGQQSRSLDELLAGLPEADRAVVQGEVRKARTEAQGLRARLKEAAPKAEQFDRLAAASQTETERLQQQVSDAEAREAKTAARAVQAEVRALAASDFADPADAAAFLDLSSYVDENGDVNSEQIEQDLKDLLARKPHLARGGKKGPKPDPSQGSSGNGSTAAKTPRDDFADFLNGQLQRS